MEYGRYLLEVVIAKSQNPEWRLGQTYFNVLSSTRPDIADKYIRGTEVDPFYRDSRIPEFLTLVYAYWEAEA